MSSYFCEEDKCNRSLFSVVATVQEESHSERIYISFYLFRIIPRNIDILNEVK